VSRKDFLNEITSGALGVTALGGAARTHQFSSPNVLFELSATLHVRNRDLHPLNSVTFLRDQRGSGGLCLRGA
jgi:hypothetical protein